MSIKKFFIIFFVFSVLFVVGFFIFRSENASESGEIFQEITPTIDGKDEIIYTNSDYFFSFKLPKGYVMREGIPDFGGIVYGGVNKLTEGSFQIYVREIGDETLVISENDIIDSNPDIKITNVEKMTVAPNEEGLAFVSSDGGIDSYEIWFVQKGLLFQLSSMVSNKELMNTILKTWKL